MAIRFLTLSKLGACYYRIVSLQAYWRLKVTPAKPCTPLNKGAQAFAGPTSKRQIF